MSSEIIIGTLLITFGLNILLKSIFGFDLPLIRWVLALGLIYWGITIILDKEPDIWPFCKKKEVASVTLPVEPSQPVQ